VEGVHDRLGRRSAAQRSTPLQQGPQPVLHRCPSSTPAHHGCRHGSHGWPAGSGGLQEAHLCQQEHVPRRVLGQRDQLVRIEHSGRVQVLADAVLDQGAQAVADVCHGWRAGWGVAGGCGRRSRSAASHWGGRAGGRGRARRGPWVGWLPQRAPGTPGLAPGSPILACSVPWTPVSDLGGTPALRADGVDCRKAQAMCAGPCELLPACHLASRARARRAAAPDHAHQAGPARAARPFLTS
jgi:hypothetical protein